jgi:hypothetical protein
MIPKQPLTFLCVLRKAPSLVYSSFRDTARGRTLDLTANPLATLTFLSAPAVLTNASCVLLFGTGNRYGRAIDRMHDLAESLGAVADTDGGRKRLMSFQLQAGERRVALIVRALSCFYSAVATFTASTLFCLIELFVRPSKSDVSVNYIFSAAFLAGVLGAVSIIGGASMLVRESWYSFRILKEERAYLSKALHVG